MDMFVTNIGDNEETNLKMTAVKMKELRNNVCLDIGIFFFKNASPFNIESPSSISMCGAIDSTTQTLLKEELRKVRILLQQNQTETAKRHVKNLISAHSISQLYSVYSQSSPSSSTKPFFIDTILSVYANSKLSNEAAQIYHLIQEDGNFPSLSAFNQFIEYLVSSSQFDKTLEIIVDVVDSGI
ncbi:pentatricopeptide repeat-containing protein [Forsythia ovata]|uniref:Pentatricopeptide repeat-containing protein n=1 Tax=Forsythia ovata TaxID=205694 RepID=A0ABD1XB78_9LAMI